jgi:molybdopterin synthase catalytic subunit
MISVKIQIESIETTPTAVPEAATGYGACVDFVGVVRPMENGNPIQGITYEAYQPMAERVMRELLEELGREHPFLAAEAIHRTGRVPVGEAAIRVRIWSHHRREAYAASMAFMDRLKQEVPIWKVATF